MTPSRGEHTTGLILVTTAAAAWSTAGLFTRLVTMNASGILFWRGLFGAIGMLALMAVLRGPSGLGSFRGLGAPGLAFSAITALSMLLFITALRNTSVAHVAIIIAIVPFIAAALGWVILRERPGRSAITSSLAALCGVAVMVGIGVEGGLYGDVMASLMAACMAGMILIARRFRDIPALATTCLASGFSALLTLPFAALVPITPHDIGIMAAFALINQVMGFGLFALGARLLPPMEAALITALDAPLAPLWVWLFFSETPSWPTIAGGTLVIAAVVSHIALQYRRP